jgi:hypothetical protein
MDLIYESGDFPSVAPDLIRRPAARRAPKGFLPARQPALDPGSRYRLAGVTLALSRGNPR